jgi:glutathione peroxidase
MKMKALYIIFGLLFLNSCSGQNKIDEKNTKAMSEKQSIYQFKVEDINGNTFDFSTLKGKKVMIVNTASKCGYTPQYAELQELYEKYKDKNFEIIGFPANNFLWQEPGSNEEIATFCQKNYGVSFPMMAKISVKGKKKHPIYEFLTKKKKNAYTDSKVKWNFQKYLIDTEGHVCGVVYTKTSPLDKQVTDWIEGK